MKKYLLLLSAHAALTACSTSETYRPVDTAAMTIRADSTTNRIVAAFWVEDSGRFATKFFPPTNKVIEWNNYWPQAHAMDVIVDAYKRTGSAAYLAMYDAWFEGMKGGFNRTQPQSSWYRVDFVDDMAWMALTMLRMYETHPTAARQAAYLERAEQIYNDWIFSEWTQVPFGGGLKWKHSDTEANGKNPCTNSPAAIIAAKLAKIYSTSNQNKHNEYLMQALQLYTWVRNKLYNSETKVLHDGIDMANGEERINGVSLTYTVGTTFAAAHLLYELTGEQHYLTDATDMADRACTTGAQTLDNTTGCLRDEGAADADGGLFKGIFMRYFVQLIADTAVSMDKRRQFHTFVQHNADVLWQRGLHHSGNYQFLAGSNWATPITERGHAGLQGAVAGATLMEAILAMPDSL